MNFRVYFIGIAILVLIVAVIFLYPVIFPDGNSTMYNFIDHFDSALKVNFNQPEAVNSYLPQIGPGKGKLILDSLVSSLERPENVILQTSGKQARREGSYRDGALNLDFYQRDRAKNRFEFRFRYKDDKNYCHMVFETGFYAKLLIEQYKDGKQVLQRESSLKIKHNNQNKLVIYYIGDFLSVVLNEKTLYQEHNNKHIVQAGSVLISADTSNENDRFAISFVPFPESSRIELEKFVEDSDVIMFNFKQYNADTVSWNGLFPEYKNSDYPDNEYIRRVQLRDLTLQSIYFLPGSSLTYKVEIPKNATLQFFLAAAVQDIKELDGHIFSVSIKDPSDDDKSMTRSYKIADFKDCNNSFIPFNLDITEFSGKICDITFKYDATNFKKSILALGSPSIYQARAKKEKNVILISLDTLASGHLSSYSYERQTTPVIDQFGMENTAFKTVVAQAPFTMPSHMSMLTSLYPNETGYIQYVSPADQLAVSRIGLNIKTLAQYLHENNFKTAGITGGGMLLSTLGFDKGFSYYFDRFNPVNDGKEMVDRGIEWLDKNKADKFFLFLHTYEIHQPYFRDYYAKDLDPAKATERDLAIAQYDSGIKYMDDQMSRLLEYLKKNDLYENTLIIITSDHGENFRTLSKDELNPEWGHHGETLFDCELKVPLFIGGVKDFKTGKSIEEQVSSVDIMPTILDYLGIEYTKGIRGVSLLPLITGEKGIQRIAYSEAVLFETYPGYDPRSIRDSSYKYIYNMPIEKYWKDRKVMETEEFYNLKTDSEETKNVAISETKQRSTYRSLIDKIIKTIKANERLLERWHSDKLKDRRDLEEHLRSLGYIG